MDWWSLGVLTYELLTGASPFTVEGEKNIPADISKRILKSQPPIPRFFSKNAKDFILKLLVKLPSKRLGNSGANEVKSHLFFDGTNWDDLLNKKVQAPFKPSICNELDTNNFAEEFTKQAPTDSPAVIPSTANSENLFRVILEFFCFKFKFQSIKFVCWVNKKRGILMLLHRLYLVVMF